MSLAEKIQAQEIVREKIAAEEKAKRDQQKEAQRQQQLQDIANQQEQLNQLQQQKADLEKELATLTPEQQAAERQKAKEAGIAEIGKKYVDQISAIAQERDKLAANKNTPQSTIRNLNGQIRVLQQQSQREISFYEFSFDNPGATISSRVYKQFQDPSNVKSLQALTELEAQRQERQRLASVQTSIRQAESERAIAQEKLDFTIRGFETARAEKTRQEAIREKQTQETQNLKPAEQGQYKVTKDYTVEIRQGNKLAEPFKDLPDVNPRSILGLSKEESKFTFEQIQNQQRDLEKSVRSASNKEEADKLRSEFQKINPYVGTSNVHEYKGIALKQQGVLIEKPKKRENNVAPIIETTTNKDITVSLTEQLNISEGIGGDITRNTSAVNIPTVLIEDKSGKVRAPDVSEMWQLTKQTLDEAQVISIPTKSDLQIAQYEKENLAEITAFEKSGKAKTSGTTKPLVNTSQDTFNAGFVGYFNEYADLARGIETKKPSLETLAVSDVKNLGEATMTKKPLQSSQLIETIQEKIKTPEGQAWLAGSAVAAGLVNAITFGGAGLLKGSSIGIKLTSLATKKTAKEAEQIAIKLSSKKIDENYIKERESEVAKDLRKRFPNLPEEKINQLSKSIVTPKEERTVIEQFKNVAPELTNTEAREIIKRNTQVPYTIDILDKNTALIVTGSETSDLNRVVLFSRKAKESQIFLVPQDQTVTYKSILARGARDDTKQIANIIKKENPNITKEDLQKQISQISQNLEQGKIIITAKEARLAQKEKPLIKSTKIRAEVSYDEALTGIKGSSATRKSTIKTTIKGTANPEYDKITIGRYKATPKNINLIEKGSEYALIGIEKTVRTKDLKSFPQQVLESIESSKDLLGTVIVERLPAKAAKAASIGKKETRPPKPGKPFTNDNITITTNNNKIEISTAKKGSKASAKTETKKLADDYQKLAETARAQIKPAKDIGREITISSQASKVSLDAAIGYKPAARQTTQQQQKSESLQNFKVLQRQSLDSDLIQISKVIPDTKLQDLIKTGIDTTLRIRQKEFTPELYDILVRNGLKESELQKLKVKITQKQKEIFEFKIPTKGPPPPREKFAPVPPPPKPVTPTGKIRIETTKPKKKGKLFFRWNVNELSPGMYLPTRELTTGKTTKAIRKVERLQAKVSKRKIKFNLNIK